MLKTSGLVLVFLACAGMGLGMARGVRRELETAEELMRLVRRIGSDVRCYKLPLPEIYDRFESPLLADFLSQMKRGATAQAFEALPADPAVRAACEPFFERVGRCSAEECERFWHECTEELGRLIEFKKEEVAGKAKVYRSLGLAGGAMAVILLL